MGWLKAGGGAAPLINLRSAQPEEGSILLLPFRLISGLENTYYPDRCATAVSAQRPDAAPVRP